MPQLKFDPHFANCEAHGKYQRNLLDERGHERWLPGCPQCSAESSAKAIFGRAAIPMRFIGRNFENFRVEDKRQGEALAQAKAFADGFADVLNNGASMTFIGAPGTGKTHLACAIANQIMTSGYSAMFVTVSEMLRSIRDTWGKENGPSESEVRNRISSVDLLILDEVGVQYGTDAEQIMLTEIINKRYENQRPLILISNLPIKSQNKNAGLIDFLGDRVYDRLRDGGKFVVFDWNSYRGKVGRE